MKLTIDGRPVEANEGESVLSCALRHEISIPHLCTHPDLEAFGGCRLCLVEIDGLRGYPASCSTPAKEGMNVRTETPALHDLRKSTLELILLEHPSACLVCDKNDLCEKYRPKAEKAGRTTGCHTCNNKQVCEVKELSADLEIKGLPAIPYYRHLPVERGDPFIDRDLNLCILCGRCVRICSHQHGTATIDFVGRGSATHVGPAFGRTLVRAGCRFCGSCVDVCPTGSLSDRFAKWHGGGDSAVETTCALCDQGCGVQLSVDAKRAVEARALDGSVPLCVLGRFALAPFVSRQDRLGVPKIRVGKVLREVGWDEALRVAAEKLKPYAGESFALVCDASATLETRHAYRRLTREVLGSPHYLELVPDARGVLPRPTLPESVRAAFVAGDLVADERLGRLEVLVLADCLPSPAVSRAHVLLPTATFTEDGGTVVDAGGARRPLRQASPAPGAARSEWRIASDLARALGSAGLGWTSVDDVTRELGGPAAELRRKLASAPPAARDPRQRRTHFRGHLLEEKVLGLKSIPASEASPAALPVA